MSILGSSMQAAQASPMSRSFGVRFGSGREASSSVFRSNPLLQRFSGELVPQAISSPGMGLASSQREQAKA